MKVIRVLNCVVYYGVDNYVCIDYLGCQSKKLSVICSDKLFEDRSYNELLGIFIPEVLMKLILCHVFTKDKNSTVILLCCNQLVEYYLEKGFVILVQKSNNLISVSNEAKQRIHAIDIHDSDNVMAFYTEIPSIEKTIKIAYYV